MRFELGEVLASGAALSALTREQIIIALVRHEAGDWGELDPDDKQRNEQALREGHRLISSYTFSNRERGVGVWVTTEPDRSYTTILLREDY